jgi:sporulation protein YlmC with PRC-barrel domain
MLLSAVNTLGLLVQADNGFAGKLADFFFDDVRWLMRYLVVNPKGSGINRVLISPAAVLGIDTNPPSVPISLLVHQPEIVRPADIEADIHVRGIRQTIGHRLLNPAGDAGRVVDVVFDSENWRVLYLIVRIGAWWKGKRVMIPTRWVADICAEERMVVVHYSNEQIELLPEFQSNQ